MSQQMDQLEVPEARVLRVAPEARGWSRIVTIRPLVAATVAQEAKAEPRGIVVATVPLGVVPVQDLKGPLVAAALTCSRDV